MISLQEVQHIAKLARLGITEQEAEKMRKELSVILDYINLLNEADVFLVATNAHLFEIQNIMREDKTGLEGGEVANAILSQFPAKEGRYAKVKEVLK